MTPADLSPAMLSFLKFAERRTYVQRMRHGQDHEWIELGDLVMDEATRYDDALAWRRADRTAGALIRRGLLEEHTTLGGLFRVSDAGLAVLGVTR